MRQCVVRRYSQLWLRSGEHEVLTLRTSVAMTLLRWRGVVKAGTDIDRVARMHIECPAMPTIYHIFRHVASWCVCHQTPVVKRSPWLVSKDLAAESSELSTHWFTAPWCYMV
jgi:hypothetical protein